jgi:HPt (histidine-containing phosphotransfer) domain-containing protein
MNSQAALSPPVTRTAASSPSLADVLSLVEVDECRRVGDGCEAKVSGFAPQADGGTREGAAPAIEMMSLLGRCLGNIDLILRVLSSFRNAGRVDLARLEQAIERADFETIVEVAHRFKGAAGNVSAPGLRKIAVSLEQFGRERNGAAVELALTQFRSEWEEFVRCADAFAPAAGVSASGPAGKST